MLFLLVRMSPWDKHQPDSFPSKRKFSAPDSEQTNPQFSDHKRQQQVIEHLRQVHANYSLDRRLF